MMKMPVHRVRINISEIRKPELDAQLVAEGIAQQLERRVMFRRAMKRAVTNTMRIGALGIKVRVVRPPERRRNRANGVVSRRPRAAAYASVPKSITAWPKRSTTYGVIGVKVWIFKGEIFKQGQVAAESQRSSSHQPERQWKRTATA